MKPPTTMYTAEQTAKKLNTTIKEIRKLIAQDKITYYKHGLRIYLTDESITQLKQQLQQQERKQTTKATNKFNFPFIKPLNT